MASEMPDIEVGHIETPTKATQLGAKGCDEASIIAVCVGEDPAGVGEDSINP